jgi:hypothetical protein
LGGILTIWVGSKGMRAMGMEANHRVPGDEKIKEQKCTQQVD